MATFSLKVLSADQTPYTWRQYLNSFVTVANSINYVMCKRDCNPEIFQRLADSGVMLGCTVTTVYTTTSKAGTTIYSLGSTEIGRAKDFYLLYVNGVLQRLCDWDFCNASGGTGTSHIKIHRKSGITITGWKIVLKECESSVEEDSLTKYEAIKKQDGILTDAESFQDYYLDEEDELIAINAALTKTRKGYL